MAGYSDSEDTLENAALALFSQLGWQTVNAYDEVYSESATAPAGGLFLGRASRNEVILRPRLEAALARLNPGIPSEAIALTIEELTHDRSAMSLAHANRQIYHLLKEGAAATFRGADGEERFERVQIVDWRNLDNNDFLMAQQFWVTGDVYTCRADLVGFVNGIPLLFGELKAHHRELKAAYEKNLNHYKDAIPHLLWYNAFILLSNGSDARLGTVAGEWEHFSPWKKINSEGEQGIISLETAVRGACAPARFLDIVENYLIYQEVRGGLAKIIAKYHQYFGVESAIEAVQQLRENQGRLGVFWHTQGSGKSIAMIFFCQKVLRRLPGNWTFLIVTDRIHLDDQIYKNFARAGVVTEPEARVRAASGSHLQQLLRQDHRYLFTLIHKFHTEHGQRHPQLSNRSDIIVLTDEAHRSQYDILALNMRHALPNAAFLAFTATPLIVGEEQTRKVFGDYVSAYSYKQSNEDNSTVPLYYENRVPEVQLTNEQLNEDMERLLEEAELDEAQEEALGRVFSDEYEVITRDERLEKVAEDIVEHFINRGYPGKGMVVSIDKLTTVRTYDKVQRYWQRTLRELKSQLAAAHDEERDALQAKIAFMEETDMAVVISEEQAEVEKFRRKGLDILPHRRRMKSEDLDEKFKDPDDPFRLAFVCAMWRTGFDVPCCSTIYLDRPMRNHTLMQTIARANRVFGEKVNGLIVDYVGIFRDLQRALAIYGTGPDGMLEPGEEPIEDKDALVERLRDAISDAEAFCAERGVDIAPILRSEGFQRIALMDAAVTQLIDAQASAAIDDSVEKIILNDELKLRYLALAGNVNRLFKAILPDKRAGEFGPSRKAFVVLADKIRGLAQPVDVSATVQAVEDLLDKSVTAQPYMIRELQARYDLSKVNFAALQERFAQGRKRTEAERLRGSINAKLQRMVILNRSRMDYLEAFQRLIDEYNIGSRNVEEFFDALVKFAQELNDEEQRGIAENLSEEELAIFDILTRPDLNLSEEEKEQVKRVARDMLDTLKAERLVLDWRKRQQTRAGVRLAIADGLDKLPPAFDQQTYRRKCELVYQHIYDCYYGEGKSLYAGL